jgi:precorrin-3B synthase
LLRISNRLAGSRSTLPEGGAGRIPVTGSLVGATRLRNSRLALGVALPFGQTSAKLLKTFAQTAMTLGVDDIRPAPGRTLVAICGTAAGAETLQETSETLGFVTSPADPRQAISACPGAPDCTSGYIPARKIAAEIASEYSGLLDGSMHIHVSGCAKGCAHPGRTELTLIGGAGVVGMVADGTARDEPIAYAASGRAGLAGIAALVEAARRPDDTTAQAVQSIGLSALAEAFGQGGK